jgi:hypothetical protein
VGTAITREYLDAAEADATRMVEFLSGKDSAQARDLAGRAFTAWARDYRELMALGRYLARHEPDATARFPGIHAERTSTRRDSGTPGNGSTAGAAAASPAAEPGTEGGNMGSES